MTSDAQHPFFRPLWRRIAIVAFCAGWAAFEFYMGNETWGWITLAVGAYGAWLFLISYQPPAEEKPAADPAPSTQDDAGGKDET